VTADVRDRLRQLTEAHQKATPGPWRWDAEFGDEGDTGLALTNDEGAEIVGAYNYHCCSFRDDPTVNDANAAAIVASHNATPWLVAALTAVLDLADELEREWKREVCAEAFAIRDAAARIRAAVAAPLAGHDNEEDGR
jgi:hypothetical protein